jgi:hypothetical protein
MRCKVLRLDQHLFLVHAANQQKGNKLIEESILKDKCILDTDETFNWMNPYTCRLDSGWSCFDLRSA